MCHPQQKMMQWIGYVNEVISNEDILLNTSPSLCKAGEIDDEAIALASIDVFKALDCVSGTFVRIEAPSGRSIVLSLYLSQIKVQLKGENIINMTSLSALNLFGGYKQRRGGNRVKLQISVIKGALGTYCLCGDLLPSVTSGTICYHL